MPFPFRPRFLMFLPVLASLFTALYGQQIRYLSLQSAGQASVSIDSPRQTDYIIDFGEKRRW